MNVRVLAPPLKRGGWEGLTAVSERKNRRLTPLIPPCQGEMGAESSRLDWENRPLNFHAIALPWCLEHVLNHVKAVKSKPHGELQTLPIRCQRRRIGIRRAVPDPVPAGCRAAQTLTARGVQCRALRGMQWLPMPHAAQ